MTAVPELPPSKVTKPTGTVIVCTKGNRKLTEQDRIELERYIEFRRQRALRSKKFKQDPR